MIEGLDQLGMVDAFRTLHDYTAQQFTWYLRRKGKAVGRRFDHVCCSEAMGVSECRYLHDLRQSGLSDHSGMLAEFG